MKFSRPLSLLLASLLLLSNSAAAANQETSSGSDQQERVLKPKRSKQETGNDHEEAKTKTSKSQKSGKSGGKSGKQAKTSSTTLSPTVAPTSIPTSIPTLPTNVPTLPGGALIIGDLCAGVTCTNLVEGCDPFDGLCKEKDGLVPCIAVIDESDNFSNSNIDGKWADFRAQYPNRPFCLLQPLDESSSNLHLPSDFIIDPRTSFAQVSRDNMGLSSAVPGPSDWFDICGFDIYEGTSDVEFIGKFLDTSGSMDLNTVAASNTLFLNKANLAGLEIEEVFNQREDWITPFIATLIPSS